VHKENLKGVLTSSVCPTFVLFVSFVAKDLDKINRPSRLRRAIRFDLSYLSTSKASPNDTGIVIIIIIIIGEVVVIEHRGAIIAQSNLI
jgi:hypothetical protein